MRRLFACVAACACLFLPFRGMWNSCGDVYSENQQGVLIGGNQVPEIRFSDEKLDFFVRSIIGSLPPVELRREQLLKVKTLDLNGLGVRSIAGIENLTEMETLCMVSNQVESIEGLAKLRQLKEVDLRHNRIADITALKNLRNLQVVHLESNRVTALEPLVANPGLAKDARVYLNGNPLDCAGQKALIAQLRARGVKVESDCP